MSVPETNNKKGTSVQVILSINYDDNRLLPLTEDCPICLLPIANRKLLGYQLEFLKQSGATEIFVVTPKEYYPKISQFILSHIDDEVLIEIIQVNELFGTADAVRAVHDRIRGDFVIYNSDTFSQINLAELVHTHRLQSSDVTMLLAVAPLEESEKKGVAPTLKIHPEDKEFIGLCDDGRVVVKRAALDIESVELELSKTLLTRYAGGGGGGIDLRCDLIDVEIYVLSHWVTEYLMANKKLNSFRSDILPQLIARQGQSNSYLRENIPGLAHRRRPLQGLEPWRVNLRGVTPSNTLLPFDVNTSLPMELSESSNNIEDNQDLLRCFSVVVDRDNTNPGNKGPICQRITTLPTFIQLNRDIPLTQPSQLSRYQLSCFQWSSLSNYLKKEQSILGPGSVLGEKVTIKQCSIGNDCKVGMKSKLNNCILIGNVEIGEGCTIQNCVLGEGTVVGNNCNLNDCYTGRGVHVADSSRLKSETISLDDGTKDDGNESESGAEGDDLDEEEEEKENNNCEG